MTKTGRNDPCPCGSGHKYKRCCLEKDEAAERRARAAANAAEQARYQAQQAEVQAHFESTNRQLQQLDELATASNAVIEMIHAGKLDEAEAAARDLLVRFPDVHDGYDRLGMVHEARGERKQAADCYRQVIDFVQARPDQYEPEFAVTFHRLIDELDPPTAG